jgi:hypothetical protein
VFVDCVCIAKIGQFYGICVEIEYVLKFDVVVCQAVCVYVLKCFNDHAKMFCDRREFQKLEVLVDKSAVVPESKFLL